MKKGRRESAVTLKHKKGEKARILEIDDRETILVDKKWEKG